MNKNEFKKLVKAKAAGPVTDKSLNVAMDLFPDLREKRHVSTILQVASRLDIAYVTDEGEGADAALTPSALIESDRLAELIKPEIEKLRKSVFKKTTPPFQSYEDGLAWIMEEFNKNPLDSKKLPGGNAPVIHPGQAPRRARPQYVLPHPEFIAYLDLEGKYGVVKTPKTWWEYIGVGNAETGSKALVRIAEKTRQLSEITGFHQGQLVWSLFTGEGPLLPLYNVKPNDRFYNGRIFRKSVTIEVFSGDLTLEQLRRLYGRVRQELRATGKRRVSRDNQRLLSVVKDLGGGPAEGETKKDFFTRVQLEYNRRARRKHFASWDSARKAYERLLKRLEGA